MSGSDEEELSQNISIEERYCRNRSNIDLVGKDYIVASNIPTLLSAIEIFQATPF